MTGVLCATPWLLAAFKLPGRRSVALAYYRLLCKLLHVWVRIVGNAVHRQPVLIVANHISWLDIPVIGSVAPIAFVAKREVADWPMVGLGAKFLRTVFVDRTRRQQTGAGDSGGKTLRGGGRAPLSGFVSRHMNLGSGRGRLWST